MVIIGYIIITNREFNKGWILLKCGWFSDLVDKFENI